MMKLKYLAVALTCLGASAAMPASAQETLKLGALVTLSGPGAAWGIGMKNAAELAADQVNAKGGLEVGGKKYKVEVVSYDDKYQANEAVTAGNRLVFEDKIQYLIGPTGSAPALAVQPLTEKSKIIILTLGFTPKLLGPDKTYTFRPPVTTGEVADPQIGWVVKKLGVKKVGGIFPNDETGQAMSKDLEAAYTKAGATFVAKEYFERDRVDFVPLITRMMARGIDAIELDGNSPTTAGLIVKQAREMGFKGKIIRTGGPSTMDIVNVAGKAATEGMYVHTPLDASLASTKAYEEMYAAKYKSPMNGFSPVFYDATNMLFEAMRKAGTVTDTEKVRNELEKLKDYKGTLGTINWTGKASYGIDHQMDAPFFIAEVKDGNEVMVARCNVSGCQ